MKQLKLNIIDNHWLEILLQQYFTELIFVHDQEADLTITESEISLTQSKQSWQLSKPIMIKEVINIIEQAQKLLTENMISLGPIKFYPDRRLCKFHGEDIELTQKESEILLYLVARPQGVDKATILNDIWGYCNEISTRTLETHIYKLRHKFTDKYELIGFNENSLYYVLNEREH